MTPPDDNAPQAGAPISPTTPEGSEPPRERVLPRSRAGRKAHQPTAETRRLVEVMAGLGAPVDHIARKLNLDPETVRKRYGVELRHGFDEANQQVAAALFRKAKTGDVAACKFWMSVRAGWREKVDVNLSGQVGGGVREKIIVLPNPVSTPGEWAQMFAPPAIEAPEKTGAD